MIYVSVYLFIYLFTFYRTYIVLFLIMIASPSVSSRRADHKFLPAYIHPVALNRPCSSKADADISKENQIVCELFAANECVNKNIVYVYVNNISIHI